MLYRVITLATEDQLKKMSFPENTTIDPLYKKGCGYEEENWIVDHAGLITDGIVAREVYDYYRADFVDKRIATKGKFYRMCRELLDLEIKMMRVDGELESCFVKKSR